MTTIKPTRRDRDAAASGYFAWCSGNPVIPSKMQSGRADDHSMVQSYAHHAAAERAIGYRMGIEAAAAKVQAEWPHDKRTLVPMIRALSDNAEAIARGE